MNQQRLIFLILFLSATPILSLGSVEAGQSSIRTKYFYITTPDKFLPFYEDIADEIDNGAIPQIAQETGIPNPYSTWYINQHAKVIGRTGDPYGEYVGNGRIEMYDSPEGTGPSKKTLIHEIIHGFTSSSVGKNINDFWWNEGNSIYFTPVIFDRIFPGSSEVARRDQTINKFLNTFKGSKNFINDWSPDQAGDYSYYGYVHSSYIIKSLLKLDGNIIKNFNRLLKQENVIFSRTNVKTQNNQFLYVLSKASNQNLYNDFLNYGFTIDPFHPVVNKINSAKSTIKGDREKTKEEKSKLTQELALLEKELYTGEFKSIEQKVDALIEGLDTPVDLIQTPTEDSKLVKDLLDSVKTKSEALGKAIIKYSLAEYAQRAIDTKKVVNNAEILFTQGNFSGAEAEAIKANELIDRLEEGIITKKTLEVKEKQISVKQFENELFRAQTENAREIPQQEETTQTPSTADSEKPRTLFQRFTFFFSRLFRWPR